jgi:hypothetical protein
MATPSSPRGLKGNTSEGIAPYFANDQDMIPNEYSFECRLTPSLAGTDLEYRQWAQAPPCHLINAHKHFQGQVLQFHPKDTTGINKAPLSHTDLRMAP